MKLFLSLFFLMASIAYADPASSLVLEHNPAPQSFQQANPPPTATPAASVAPSSPATAVPAVTTAALSTPAVSSKQFHALVHAFKVEKQNNHNALNDINQKLITASQALLDFQQKLAQQNVELMQKNQDLQNQVNTLVQIMKKINSEVGGQNTSNLLIWLLGLLALNILSLILIIILFATRGKIKKASNKKEDVEQEYDFLGSKEGIQARLDLARVYIEMDRAADAKEILQSIMKEGNDAQKAEAKKLLIELGT